jgi:hypothetical protein
MKTVNLSYDFVVLGGGLAGMCAAVTAARAGIRTALVQDRPVLGGNASTEIRVPPVGAANCNFAYARETGLIEELFLNNLYRNRTWCPEGWNLELESLVRNEATLDLFLNTAVCDVILNESGARIQSVKAHCAIAETWYHFHGPFFADCTGDGTVGALAGAVFRQGAEARSEFNEDMCAQEASAHTMGMSIQMHTRDTGQPMPFRRPAWVDMELGEEDFGPYRPVCDDFFPDTGGFWWLELGGDRDAIHDTLAIKDDLQKVTLAVWDYLKNRSSLKDRLTTYELEWMGAVPGKRESRRFEGDHILTMSDIDTQADFEDAVAYGGWGFDHHPPRGFHDKVNPSIHRYLRGPHNIPLRSLYSRNIANLYLAGRNISATHYALSSTRVMLTCAQLGEAVGIAAVHSVRHHQDPPALVTGASIRTIQTDLQLADHHIHAFGQRFEDDIAQTATVTASSTFTGQEDRPSWATDPLTDDRMLQLPIVTPQLDTIRLRIDANSSTVLQYSLFQGPANGATYPDREIMQGACPVSGTKDQWIELPCACPIARPGWHFLVLKKNPALAVHMTESPPGQRWYYPRPADPIRPNVFSQWTALTLDIGMDRAVEADGAKVTVPCWTDHALQFREFSRFLHYGYCAQTVPVQPVYEPHAVVNPHSRPTSVPNLWVSAPTRFASPEWLDFTWDRPQWMTSIQILFDSSLHFHFWQSWQGYPVQAIPSIVKDYRIVAHHVGGYEHTVIEVRDNYQRNRRHALALTNVTGLRIEVLGANGIDRAQIYSVRLFQQHT